MRTIGLFLFVAACSSSSSPSNSPSPDAHSSGPPPPPTCQTAGAHYYGANCVILGSNGSAFTEETFITDCEAVAAAVGSASAACMSDFTMWLGCLAEVPSPATTNAQCDCNGYLTALQTCH